MLDMTDRKHQDASKASPWEKLPLEVVGSVMKRLDLSDLKSCRLLNKSTTEEATRELFSTLQLGPTPTATTMPLHSSKIPDSQGMFAT